MKDFNEGYIKGLQEAHRLISSVINEGWTGFFLDDTSTQGIIKVITDRFYTWDANKSKGEVIKATLVGNTYYCLLRYTDKKTNETYVTIGVALISRDGDELRVKDMTEDMGPNAYTCPMSYLKQADAPRSEDAAEWRRKCGDTKAQVDTYNGLSEGDVITLKSCTLGGQNRVYFAGWHPSKRKPYMLISLQPGGQEYSVRLPKDSIESISKV